MDNPYWSQVRLALPRLLSMGDREPLSSSYGCFDRPYWAWKFTDFPGARYQEAAYALAWLYSTDVEGSHAFAKEKTLAWLEAALARWLIAQHKDGSFDEAYPQEHSLAATAFTCFYLGEALALAQDAISADLKEELLAAFGRAGNWLCRNDETHGFLSNHLATAAAALSIISHLTGEARFTDRMRYFLEKIYSRQSDEGWYEEYGGADIGYQTHGTFYLACIWQRERDERLLESLRRANAFLSWFVHPNGTIGGEYASRNTEFYFPAGYEILKDVCPHASAIASFMRNYVEAGESVGLPAMDPFNFYPMLNNYLFAARQGVAVPKPDLSLLACKRNDRATFPQAGLQVVSNEHYYAAMAASKGGVLRAWRKKDSKPFVFDSGYWGKADNGDVVTSQGLAANPEARFGLDETDIEASFTKLNQVLMRPWLFVGFRVFTLSLGRMRAVAYGLKWLLVRLLVTRKRPVSLSLRRKVRFLETAIEITDEVTGADLSRYRLFHSAKFSAIHMGSARYFHRQEWDLGMDEAVAGAQPWVRRWECR